VARRLPRILLDSNATICSRRDTALVLFGPGGSAAGPKPGRASFSD
jgi:hypothetical protein